MILATKKDIQDLQKSIDRLYFAIMGGDMPKNNPPARKRASNSRGNSIGACVETVLCDGSIMHVDKIFKGVKKLRPDAKNRHSTVAAISSLVKEGKVIKIARNTFKKAG